MSAGSLKVGTLAGAAVHLHWTLPLGIFFFSGFRWNPLGWVCFVGLVLIHELGHALAVRAVGATPTRIVLSGFGGFCEWRGEVSPISRAVIAWGGPFAQLVLLVGAMAWVAAFGFPRDATGWAVVSALLTSNLWLMLVNLIPIAPLDGAEAWWLPVLLGRAARRRPARTPFDDGEADFEAGARTAEVKALVKGLLDDARKDQGP